MPGSGSGAGARAWADRVGGRGQALMARGLRRKDSGHDGVGVGSRAAGGAGQRPGGARLPGEQLPSQGELRQGSLRRDLVRHGQEGPRGPLSAGQHRRPVLGGMVEGSPLHAWLRISMAFAVTGTCAQTWWAPSQTQRTLLSSR
ncbi:unnamed protein product [Gulo gulo]|uniref:Uncharacterized protein n=1 Tax=Gulo gulo TaxID=48420 RepID=A0A9X9MBI3_GULGU|nr:unnamed protein product [Gulo gulo]